MRASRTGWFAPRWPNGSLNVSRPSARPSSWWPRQMPKSGTRPSSPRTVSIGPCSTDGSPGPVADEHRAGRELEDRVRVPVARDDRDLDAGRREPARDRALAAEVDEDDARAGADEVRLVRPTCAVERPAVDRRLGERARMELRDRRVADGAAEDAVLADAPYERARVDVVDRDDALLAEPGRPSGPRRAHDDRLGLHAVGLGARRVDAVVADERICEAEHLGDVARVGRRLLVAGARGREARLARGDARGADERPGKTVPSSRTSAAERLMTCILCGFMRIMQVMATLAILGASGYAGQETLDRALRHPELEVVALGSDSLAGSSASALDVRLNGSLPAFVANDEALGRRRRPDLALPRQRAGGRVRAAGRRRRRRSLRRAPPADAVALPAVVRLRASAAGALGAGATRCRSSGRRRAADREPRLLRDRGDPRARAARATRSSRRASSSTRSRACRARAAS